MNKIGKATLEKINHPKFNPQLKKLLLRIIPISTIDFSVVSTVRDDKEQIKLFSQGRTTPGQKVTNCDGINKRSKHQVNITTGYGEAFDVVPYPKGYNASELIFKQLAEYIVEEAKKDGIRLRWGGNFTLLQDFPHFERVV